MGFTRFFTILALFVLPNILCAQNADSIIDGRLQLPTKYLHQVNKKVDQYYDRLTNKTTKTLQKLSRWENKIKPLLQKVSPQTAEQLFGNGAVTFTQLLQKYQEGISVADNYKAQYNEYQDKLTTSITYLCTQKDNIKNKYIKPALAAKEKITKLQKQTNNSAYKRAQKTVDTTKPAIPWPKQVPTKN
jgi:hypothetical protein